MEAVMDSWIIKIGNLKGLNVRDFKPNEKFELID